MYDASATEKAAWALSKIGDPDVTPAVNDAFKVQTHRGVPEAEVRTLLRAGKGGTQQH